MALITSLTTVSAVISGKTYNLTDGSIAWRIDEDGLGMAPNHGIFTRGPQQHGQTRVGFRLDHRTIMHIFGIMGATESLMYTARDALLRIFEPQTSNISMLYNLSNGSNRQIDCSVVGPILSFAYKDRMGFAQKCPVILQADDPTFYDPIRQSVSFVVTGGGTPLAIPLAVPMNVGATSFTATNVINYPGSWFEYPVITIYGPVTDLKITNAATNEVLDFTGTTIAAGKVWEIDCRYGYKTVRDITAPAAPVNKIASLLTSSDLATFHLLNQTNGSTTPMANSISMKMTSTNSSTAVYVAYYNRYIGL